MTYRKPNTQIFSVNTNAKTVKGNKYGYLTGVLYLAPFNLSGVNTCPYASKGCAAACLNTAGRGKMTNVQERRVAKTKLFFENRENFWDCIVWGIRAVIRKAKREGLIPVIRMNGTSDITWERIRVTTSKGETARNIMDMFPGIIFYDYTKNPFRFTRPLPKNYSLTFSLAEDNDTHARTVLDNGGNVAVVFDTKKGKALPAAFWGVPVVDGDDSDLRFLDPNNVIVGLRAKGDGRGDKSGFVRSAAATDSKAA